jgi:hypothetical protein
MLFRRMSRHEFKKKNKSKIQARKMADDDGSSMMLNLAFGGDSAPAARVSNKGTAANHRHACACVLYFYYFSYFLLVPRATVLFIILELTTTPPSCPRQWRVCSCGRRTTGGRRTARRK